MNRFTLLAAVVACTTVAFAAPSLARADVVTTWNLNATNSLIGTAGQPPPVAVIHLAMVHGAVYDAVNAIDGGHEGYLLTSRVATPFDSKDAAAATAAYRMLVNLVPSQKPTLDPLYAASLAGIPDDTSKTRGIAVGEAAASAMLAARTADGRFGSFRFAVGADPGVWRPVLPAFVNDPNAWVKDVKPFLIRSASQFRTEGPLELTSRKYAKELDEVKSVGSATSTTRTDDQTLAAKYWNEQPAGTWSRIFRTLAASHNLSTVDASRFFAELYMTAADAFVSVWDSKAAYTFWRPITAIREADTDGNPATEADPNWLPLIPTPPYPDEPSGHTGFSGSVVATLQDFFCTDDISWTDTNLAGLSRSFTHASDAIEEIIGARVWSGIHFRTADEHGAKIGKQVAKYRERHYFKPVRHDDED